MSKHAYMARSPVPPHVRRGVASLELLLGRKPAMAALHINETTYLDVVAPGGTARPEMIAKLASALAAIALPTATK
jgi:hypothetical protein